MLAAAELSFGYRRDQQVLTRWSAQFNAGEMTAMTGVSGRGKSTALFLLGLMLRPQHGAVLWRGEQVSARSDAARTRLRAAEFAFVFQDAALDPTRSVLDNVCEAALYRGQSRRTAQRQAEALLDRLGVWLRVDHRPGEISGGQAQRVAVCRALLGRPRLILADEPTGSLDPASADVVLTTLREAAQDGATVVIATHDPGVLARADRQIHL